MTCYYVLNASGAIESVSRAPVNVDDVVSRGGSVVESETFVADIDLLDTVAPGGEVVYKSVKVPTLAEAKAAKAALLDAACAAQIVGGFTSGALGQPHGYPSKAADQANLTASVLDALLNVDDPVWVTPFWCADSTGAWSWRPHTAAQIKHVGRDCKAAVIAAQTKNAELQAAVAAATTVAELEAITW